MARLVANATLRTEVEAAMRLGLPLSTWTTWSDDDRGWALAWIAYEAGRCSGCGGWLPETTDPDNEFNYHADDPVQCHRCAALHTQQDAMRDHPKRAALMLWPVKLRRTSRG